jgi:alkylation response protein AidB-like acyl-CoA dehydrogenase
MSVQRTAARPAYGSSSDPAFDPGRDPACEPAFDPAGPALEPTLAQIASRAGELDASPHFPAENFASLRAAGVVQLAADRRRCDLIAEAQLIRRVAGADASTARILDGHFNGVERLALLAEDEQLRTRELQGVADGELLLGVWGADPAPGEGSPAWIDRAPGGELVLEGVKTFCSGAGGVQRALVIARDEGDARRIAYVDVTRGMAIDRAWYRASGLRASESHRVEFQGAPVLALLGGPDEIMREPWFARDAVRTSATWAGIADLIVRATVDALAGRATDEVRLHAIGRMRLARSSIDRWLTFALATIRRVSGAPSGARCRANAAWRSPTPRARSPARRRACAARARSSQAARSTAAGATWTCSCCSTASTPSSSSSARAPSRTGSGERRDAPASRLA